MLCFGILAQLTPDELRFAVMSKDIKAISAAPGIGKKTAEKLIVELKDKLKIEDVLDHQVEAANGAAEDTVNAQGLQADAVQAITALGYGSTEALQAVRKVDIGKDDSWIVDQGSCHGYTLFLTTRQLGRFVAGSIAQAHEFQ